MFDAMMDPEMLRLAQEQMSRMSPNDLARIQEQMMSNPDLIKLATESMKNLRPEDMRNAAEQFKHVRPEEMAEISEKMAKATPEELAAIRARADAYADYELNAAQMLKKQGNDLHNQEKFREAAQKYLHAKNNLKNLPVAKGKSLKLACSLNLMSCYLKTGQYEDCISEGSEVLTYDAENVKALYRRGQAYKELGNLKAAISDLSKAHEVSPDDETIASVLRDANEKHGEGRVRFVSQGVIIEEITEEEIQPTESVSNSDSKPECLRQPHRGGEYSQSQAGSSSQGHADAQCSEDLKDKVESARSFHNFGSNTDLNGLAALSAGGLSPDMLKTASDMIKKMPPEELQKMLEMASSLNQKGPNGLHSPGMSPSMVKTASEMISKMPPEELQKLFEASSLKGKGQLSSKKATSSDAGKQRSKTNSSGKCSWNPEVSSICGSPANSESLQHFKENPEALRSFHQFVSNADHDTLASMSGGASPDMVKTATDMIGKISLEELQKMFELASSFDGKFPSFPMATTLDNSTVSSDGNHHTDEDSNVAGSSLRSRYTNTKESVSPANIASSTAGLQKQMMSQMKDPAVRQIFTSMMKNMNPDMMASMSEKFGVKLTREEAAKAQQAMSSLSPEDLDRMMWWVDRLNTAANGVRKTKNWLLGRPGMIFAIAMLILAVILHRLGFIGG